MRYQLVSALGGGKRGGRWRWDEEGAIGRRSGGECLPTVRRGISSKYDSPRLIYIEDRSDSVGIFGLSRNYEGEAWSMCFASNTSQRFKWNRISKGIVLMFIDIRNIIKNRRSVKLIEYMRSLCSGNHIIFNFSPDITNEI